MSAPQEWVTIILNKDGSIALKGSCLDEMQKTSVLMAQGMRDYHAGKIYDRVKEKLVIRPPSLKDQRELV